MEAEEVELELDSKLELKAVKFGVEKPVGNSRGSYDDNLSTQLLLFLSYLF